MADIVDLATRSRMMAGIRGKDTKPESLLRSSLHRAGFRYRLHVAGLPGRPDIVLVSRRVAIFVHGCFWHRHKGCHWCTTPASNVEFWQNKFARNVERDKEAMQALADLGWRTAIVWECALRKAYAVETVVEVDRWIRSDMPFFESALVRSDA
ncbi:very short patch repair endonuclease [Bosea vaviloviae]|uniref:Very short patch repair endonuclease n=1 Tax=Bosea vaviloviae TaxID=1526658 RepID=A0A1D7TYW2_9HYPH|nr:DNA mismatch endonuclease Vsr [Bosea vaviloviae]AOO80312.1 very short patch repair endonuclease [Bosea vaviloviae]